MINNTNDITNFEPSGKVYLPSKIVNSSYDYYFNNANNQLVVNVRTRTNCRQSGTQNLCNCYQVYINNDYYIAGPYDCNVNSSVSSMLSIPFSNITNDINESRFARERFFQDKFIMFGMLIIALLFFISLRKGYRYK